MIIGIKNKVILATLSISQREAVSSTCIRNQSHSKPFVIYSPSTPINIIIQDSRVAFQAKRTILQDFVRLDWKKLLFLKTRASTSSAMRLLFLFPFPLSFFFELDTVSVQIHHSNEKKSISLHTPPQTKEINDEEIIVNLSSTSGTDTTMAKGSRAERIKRRILSNSFHKNSNNYNGGIIIK